MIAKTKTVITAALILATASVALSSVVNAAPRSGAYQAEQNYQDRASQSYDGAGF